MKSHNAWLWVSLSLGFLLFLHNSLWASESHTATITKFFGKAQILSNPSPKKSGSPPHVLFENLYYSIAPARIGSKLQLGDVIQTSEKSLVRLVYSNGDQIMISASTSFKITTEKKQEVEKPISDLIYGKFRAVISKDGPRNNLEVRTRTMVMGIRGTDFQVVAQDETGASVVSVMRGRVSVTEKQALDGTDRAAIEVKSGYSAKIAAPILADTEATTVKATAQKQPSIAIQVMDKLDLGSIKEGFTFQNQETQKSSPEVLDPSLTAELDKLEDKALEATKKDIKIHDPELFKRIETAEAAGTKIKSAEVLQALTLEKALAKAPEAPPEKLKGVNKSSRSPPAKKPDRDQLEGLDGGIYDKYFKP